MIDMRKVEKKADELSRDLELVAKELKKIQSVKCRLKKEKGRTDYNKLMSNVLAEEELLKEVRQLLDPKEKFVTEFTEEDVKRLDYDQTIKAIRSIQSKKVHTRWLTCEDGNNDDYRQACKIETMLISHRDEIKPVEDTYIRKTDLVTIIDTIKSSGDLKTETIVEMLEKLL